MKRVFGRCMPVVASLTMICTLSTGCGFEYNSETETETADVSQNGQFIVVGIAQVGSESDWRTTNTKSYATTFTEENGYHLLFEDGQQEQENQVKAVREFILQGVDYIVIDPVVETGWESVLEEARDAGIPVILVDRQISTDDESL